TKERMTVAAGSAADELKDARHVCARFRVGRDSPESRHRSLAGVIRGKRQFPRPAFQQRLQMLDAGLDVRRRVERVGHRVLTRGLWHELHQADRAFAGPGALLIRGLNLNDRTYEPGVDTLLARDPIDDLSVWNDSCGCRGRHRPFLLGLRV